MIIATFIEAKDMTMFIETNALSIVIGMFQSKTCEMWNKKIRIDCISYKFDNDCYENTVTIDVPKCYFNDNSCCYAYSCYSNV